MELELSFCNCVFLNYIKDAVVIVGCTEVDSDTHIHYRIQFPVDTLIIDLIYLSKGTEGETINRLRLDFLQGMATELWWPLSGKRSSVAKPQKK